MSSLGREWAEGREAQAVQSLWAPAAEPLDAVAGVRAGLGLGALGRRAWDQSGQADQLEEQDPGDT